MSDRVIELVKLKNGALRGMGEDNDRAWKRFKGWVKRLEAGEFFTLTYKQPRNAKFLKKWFALMKVGFDHWEPSELAHKGKPVAKDFERFRKDITILAGFYRATYGINGEVSLEAESVSFASMSEEDFERLYEATKAVLIQQVLTNYTGEEVDRVVREMEDFDT